MSTHTLATPKAIIGTLEQVTVYGFRMRRIFEDWVRMCETTLMDLSAHVAMVQAEGRLLLPEEERAATQALWTELADRYGEKWPICANLFRDAFQMLLSIADREGIHDILGPIYQKIGSANSNLGQFFTPWSLCLLMAQLTDPTPLIHQRLKAALTHPDNQLGHALLMASQVITNPSEAERFFCERLIPAALPYYEPVVINDPCVGSGATLLAAAATVPAWANAYGLIRYCGQDIDLLCVQMARVQCLLFGLHGPSEQLVLIDEQATDTASLALHAVVAG
jgi:type I restriction-modification system DNA methylase subunit